jgi:hypothetical protein
MAIPATADSLDLVPVLNGGLRRALAAAGLGAIAVIHLIDTPGKFEETPYLGVLFVALIAACLAVAELLVRRNSMLAWASGAVLAGATAAAYAVSRTAGLPGAPSDDIGNWAEPLGLASLLVEGIVVWLCLSGLLEAARRSATR